MAKTIRRRITRPSRRPLPQRIQANTVAQSYFLYKGRRYPYTIADAEMEKDFEGGFVKFFPEGKRFAISDETPKDLRQYMLIHELLVHNVCCDDISPNKQALTRLIGEIVPA